MESIAQENVVGTARSGCLLLERTYREHSRALEKALLFFGAMSTLLCSVVLTAVCVFCSASAAQSQPVLKHVFSNPNPAVQDFFGTQVAMDGDYALIGASGDDTHGADAGRAFLYDAVTGNLLHIFSDPSPASMIRFGTDVDISGNLIVIGARDDRPTGERGPGRAFVFDAVTGTLLHTLENPQPGAGDSFGGSLAIDGNKIVIGAALDDSVASNTGQAFVFDAATGSLLHLLRHPTPAAGDFLGARVAIENDTIVVSATGDDTGSGDAGQIVVFDAVTGNVQRTINNPSPATGDLFGGSLAIDGDKIVVSTVRDNTYGRDSGLSHVFDVTSGALVHTFHDPVPPTDLELFGAGAEIDGNDIYLSNNPNLRGRDQPIFVFHFDATTGALLHTFEDPSQVAHFTSFGSSIARSGNRLLISAPGDFERLEGAGQVFLYEIVPEPGAMTLIAAVVVLGFIPPRRGRSGAL